MKKEVADNNKLPNKEVNNFRLMTQLIELKKHKKAYKICEQILKKYPKNGETLAVKGYLLILLDEKNKDEAFKFIKEGIKNNLSSSFCWYLYGCLYKIYKNYDESLKCFMKAIQLNKYDYKALKEACILLLYLKKYEQFKDLRLDMYKDSAKSVRDKAILIFSFHLIKNYEKCYVIIKQIESDLINDNDLTSIEKHDLLIYMSEILLEGKMFNECLVFLKTHEKELLDKLWFNQMMGLIYLYENNFPQANFFFKEAFSFNYENLNLLLLILFTENNIYIDNKNNNGEGIKRIVDETDNSHLLENKSDKRRTLSSLFYLDYKNEHKENEKVNINNDVKVLLHECILDIYGSDKNLKLLAQIDKNILNDYICHNLEMNKYDVYTIFEFNNFININLIDESKFKDNLDSDNINEYINSLKINLKKEKTSLSSIKDIYSYNNIHWSEHFGVDLIYCHKKKFEKNMNILYFYKIKNLNEEEENCFENYFKNLQRVYAKSNLLKIFPLHFYNEKKFSYYVEKLLRSLLFKNSLTIFNYFKSLFTFKNIKIILFILHKYIDQYDKGQNIFPFLDDKCNDCNADNSALENEEKEKIISHINNGQENNVFEKRECLLENGLENNMEKQNENINELEDEKRRSESTKKMLTQKSDKEESCNTKLEENKNNINQNHVENSMEEKEKINSIIEVSSLEGKKKKDEKIEAKNFDKEKKEIKIDLKKVCLTKEEKNEYFILCVYSLISQIYNYINCTEEALSILNKGINNIKYNKNERIKYELIFIKGIIYKRNGNYLESYKYLEQCRNYNLDDRYINSKTIKTCLKCGLIKDAKKISTPFTNPLDNNFLKNINETQCFWIEYNMSLSYINNHPNIHLNKYLKSEENNIYTFKDDNDVNTNNVNNNNSINNDVNNNNNNFNLKKSVFIDNNLKSRNKLDDYRKGLHLLHLAHKQFIDINEDQICFYHYALRKMLFKTYRHLLYMTGNIFSSRFYRKIGKNIIKILLHMHDYDISERNESNKNNKKKNKSNTSNQEDNESYEHIKKDPLENAMIYMNTFLSQPNVDLSVYKLNYEIIKRKDKDYVKMINNILKIKSIFPHHNYNYKLAPLISHYLHTVSLNSMNEEVKKDITAKLNKIFNFNYLEYNDELLKEIRKKYIEDYINFFNEYKKGDLSYYQSVLEMFIDCGEPIEERLLSSVYMNPEKNKLQRCFKFLKFLIINRKKYSEFNDVIYNFKAACTKAFPLATAFH